MKVFVKTLTGHTITVDLEENNTIKEIVNKIRIGCLKKGLDFNRLILRRDSGASRDKMHTTGLIFEHNGCYPMTDDLRPYQQLPALDSEMTLHELTSKFGITLTRGSIIHCIASKMIIDIRVQALFKAIYSRAIIHNLVSTSPTHLSTDLFMHTLAFLYKGDLGPRNNHTSITKIPENPPAACVIPVLWTRNFQQIPDDMRSTFSVGTKQLQLRSSIISAGDYWNSLTPPSRQKIYLRAQQADKAVSKSISRMVSS